MAIEEKTANKNKYFSNINNEIDNIGFDLSNVDTSLANSLRRVILSEIPTYGFEDEPDKTFHHYLDIGLPLPPSVKVLENTSGIHNEFLGHRVGLIPVCSTRPVTTQFNETLLQRIYHPYVDSEIVKNLETEIKNTDDASSEGRDKINTLRSQLNRELNTPEFVLHVKNTKIIRSKLRDGSYFNVYGRGVEPKTIRDDDAIDVTSDMFIIKDDVLNEHNHILPDPVILENFGEMSYPLIIRLKPTSDISDTEGQSVHITAKPTVGIAKWHSKYCPVGTVTYQFKRDENKERIHQVFQNMMMGINKNRTMKGVKEIDIDNIFDSEHNMVSTNKEVIKYWNSFDILGRDKIYELDDMRSPKYYEFCVESIGHMQPAEIVYWGMYMLRLKMIDLVTHIETDYVKFDRAKSVMDAIDIEIVNENHTVGNIIANHLKFINGVTFSTYKMPHPLDERIYIRVQLKNDKKSPLTYKERVVAVFKTACNNIIDQLSEMMIEWINSTNKYLKSGGIGFNDYIIDNATNDFFTKKTEVVEPPKTKIKSKSSKSLKSGKVKVRML